MFPASLWFTLAKGAPQGSLMGPFIHHIFTNDLLLQVTRNGDGNIYNYADDNRVSAWDKTVDGLNNKLRTVSCLLLQWFTENYIQASASKF